MSAFKRGIAKLKLIIVTYFLKSYDKYLRKYLHKENIMYYNGGMWLQLNSFKNNVVKQHNELMKRERGFNKNGY